MIMVRHRNKPTNVFISVRVTFSTSAGFIPMLSAISLSSGIALAFMFADFSDLFANLELGTKLAEEEQDLLASIFN